MSQFANHSPIEADAEKSGSSNTSNNNTGRAFDSGTDFSEEVLVLQGADPAMDKKMHLVNNTLDEIGWTTYHWKLFFLSGFGYAVDALQLSLQGIISVQAVIEFQPSYAKGLTIALYMGMLVGALFWGFTADIIGRRIAFNISLFICSVFTIVAGASPSWESLGFFIALAAFGAGGNLILDTTVFMEYLPSNKQWLVSLLAAWFGVGCTIAGLVAWGFMPNFSCADASNCTRANNSGWRYLMYTIGAFIFVLSVLRVTIIRLRETPKFLLGQGKDAEVVHIFKELADQYNRPCSLTVEQLEECGVVSSAHSPNRFSIGEFLIHFRALFLTKKVAATTILLWLSWSIIGLAYPLFVVFLPYYLASRGVQFGVISTYQTWRNYALVQVCGIFGPMVGGPLANVRFIGRRYAMIIGALITMAFFFAYSQVSSQDANVAYSCVISFTLQIYYGVLYGYTSEVLPAAHRATGNGIAIAFCRLAGAMSAVVVTYANPNTTAPVFICAALYGGLAICAFMLPFEPYGKRAS
ncbi:MFS transporter [Penicillium waksmanii]|uniref:MFS transporter n=1 Tax=Penicillium waksmanii TaxID=69791 RepID=UPI0025473883|nr:MFS transporter [Penicillium waksmanii]KAJ5976443.1 MFS transporter [Penicillium waksmanii]